MTAKKILKKLFLITHECKLMNLKLISNKKAVCQVCDKVFDRDKMDLVGKNWFDYYFKQINK